MQSKTSSCKIFNSTLIWKNIKRCWPVMAGYAFILTWIIPGMLYFNVGVNYYGEYKLTRLLNEIYWDIVAEAAWVAVAASIIVVVSVMFYLDNERASSFYHSLPITRTGLYASSFLSSIIILWIPNIVVYGLGILACGNCAGECLKGLSIWLLVISVYELFFLSLAMLICIIHGSTVWSFVTYIFSMFFVYLIIAPVNGLYEKMYYGMSPNLITIPDNFLGIVSPLAYMEILHKEPIYENDQLVGYILPGIGGKLVTVMIFATVFAVFSILLYRNRKSELSHDYVAIEFLKPVFRWGIGIVFGLFITWLLSESMLSYYNYMGIKRIFVIVSVVLFSFVGFIAVEMIMRKSFRVFKRSFKEIIIFVTFVFIGSIIMVETGRSIEHKIPEESEIKSVYVVNNFGSAAFTDEKNIKALTDIHRYISDNSERMVDSLYGSEYYTTMFINFTYTLENGKVINRYYSIPAKDTKVYDMIYDFCNGCVEKMIFDDCKPENFIRANVDMMQNDGHIVGTTIYDNEMYMLYDAVLKDIEEKNLTFEIAKGNYIDKYMVNEYYTDDNSLVIAYEEVQPKEFPYNYLSIEFQEMEKNEDGVDYYETYMFNFNQDCTNIINFINNCDSIQTNLSMSN